MVTVVGRGSGAVGLAVWNVERAAPRLEPIGALFRPGAPPPPGTTRLVRGLLYYGVDRDERLGFPPEPHKPTDETPTRARRT